MGGRTQALLTAMLLSSFLPADWAVGAPEKSKSGPLPFAITPACSPPWETFVPPKIDPATDGEPARKPDPFVRTPPPAKWSVADRRKLEALQAVCAAAYRAETNDERVYMGCRSCDLGPSTASPLPVGA